MTWEKGKLDSKPYKLLNNITAIFHTGAQVWGAHRYLYVLYISYRPNQEHNQDNERASMNEQNTLLYKNISLILFSKGAHSLSWVWEIDGETYTQRGDFFLPHIFFRESGGCQRLHPLASRIIRGIWDTSDRLPIPGSTSDSLDSV